MLRCVEGLTDSDVSKKGVPSSSRLGRHYIHLKLYDLSTPLHSVNEILQIRSCTLYRMFEKTVKILVRLNKKEKITNSGTSLFALITTHTHTHTHTQHCFANREKEDMMGGPYRIHAGDSK
jgi:serine/threonine protein phosphatase PrpC